MNELVQTEKQVNFIAALERVAINPDVDVLKMEKIMDLQERVLDKASKAAYSQAMCKCQADMPTVLRDSDNAQTRSKYAKFETVLMTTKPCYTSNGFALSFGTAISPVEDHIRITCDIMHIEGHSEFKFVDLPMDNKGMAGKVNKTDMHATASTYSYGERYLFCMIFNVTIADHDNDGVVSGPTAQDLIDYMEVVRGCFASIHAVKEAFLNEEWAVAAEAFHELTKDEKDALWLAPSKGGVFTTKEVATFKCNDYVKARMNFTRA